MINHRPVEMQYGSEPMGWRNAADAGLPPLILANSNLLFNFIASGTFGDVHKRRTSFNVDKEQKVVAFKMLALAVGIAALATSAAIAHDRGEGPGFGWGKGGSEHISFGGRWDHDEHEGSRPGGGTSVGVPGPIAGAGLPAAALVGGYIWLRRRQRRVKPELERASTRLRGRSAGFDAGQWPSRGPAVSIIAHDV